MTPQIAPTLPPSSLPEPEQLLSFGTRVADIETGELGRIAFGYVSGEDFMYWVKWDGQGQPYTAMCEWNEVREVDEPICVS